jgi:hypothetical protein
MSLRTKFLADLCEEHGSEVGFLYERRTRTMDQSLVQWPLLEDLEERIEAHAEAMVVEPEPVGSLAEQWLADGDAGLAYAGLRGLAGATPNQGFWEAFTATPWEDGARARAATDALIAVATTDWTSSLAERLAVSQGLAAAALAKAAVVRRLPVGGALQAAARRETGDASVLLWALGQLDCAEGGAFLFERIYGGPPATRRAAATALLRIADKTQIVAWLVSQLDQGTWPVLPLALSGDPRAVGKLLQVAPTNVTEADWALALGLVGSPASFDRLVSALANDEVAEAAASALQVVTGAGLIEEIVTVDEDILDPEELVALRAGRLDPRRVGEVHRRLCRDQKRWRAWLDTRRNAFLPGQRYRHGRPFTAPTASSALLSEWLPRAWRDLEAEELEIQSKVRLGLYSDLPVREQRYRLSTVTPTNSDGIPRSTHATG